MGNCAAARKAPVASSAGKLSTAAGTQNLMDEHSCHNLIYTCADQALPCALIGTYSNHGIETDANGCVVHKKNQDRAGVAACRNGAAIFTVMDGHGAHGDKVSEHCLVQLHEILNETDEAELTSQTPATLIKAYDQLEQWLRSSCCVDCHRSGTTATTAILNGNRLTIAHVGDSRAVLASKCTDGSNKYRARDVTPPHRPEQPKEACRIDACGGIVTCSLYKGDPVFKLTNKSRCCTLSLSRAFGDLDFSECGVITTPDVVEHELTSNDVALIVASDGVWDVLSSQEATDIVCSHLDDATAACRCLVLTATANWVHCKDCYRDDITATVVFTRPCTVLCNHTQENQNQLFRAQELCVSPELTSHPTSANCTLASCSKSKGNIKRLSFSTEVELTPEEIHACHLSLTSEEIHACA